jgi:HD-GYP domain-containing protein (c-di-GMP phosphodiesterase class II)
MVFRRAISQGGTMQEPVARRIRSPELLIEKWLSEPRGGQLIESMQRLEFERNFIERGIANLADEVWLGHGGQNPKLALQMVEKRIAILTAVTADYCKLATDLGWDVDAIEKSATILMPYFDVSERACYTYYGHQHRSMQYAEMILDAKGVCGDERALILLGVLLHDLGKVGVPGSLLRKAGKLADEEKDIIRRHPEYSSIIINKAIRVVAPIGNTIQAHGSRIAEIAYTHHEQISGKGYPRGLVKEQIDIGGRVAGLCDSIEAMSSKRIYHGRPSATFEDVVAEANKQLNDQFNGDLVKNFLGAVERQTVLERIFEIIKNAGGVP